MEDLPCDCCGKLCKGEKGLHVHRKKCKGQAEPQCTYCDTKFSRFANLAFHLTICSKHLLFKQNEEHEKKLSYLYKEQSIKETEYQTQLEHIKHQCVKKIEDTERKADKAIDDIKYQCIKNVEDTERKADKAIDDINTRTKKVINDLEDKINKERSSTSYYLDLVNQRDNEKHELKKQFKEQIDKKEEEIKELKARIATMESQLINTNNDISLLIRRSTSGGNTTLTTNHTGDSMYNNNNITVHANILNFDPVKLHDKVGIECIISDHNKFAEFINKAVGEHFRVTDASRANLIWKDESGKEIKDTGGKQLIHRVIDEISDDFVVQKDKADKRRVDQNLDIYQRDSAAKTSEFSSLVLERNDPNIHNIGKKLGKLGTSIKNKNPVKSSTSNENNFYITISALQKQFADHFFDWIDSDLNQFIDIFHSYLKPYIKGLSDRQQKPCFIYLKNDNHRQSYVFAKDCHKILIESLSPLLLSDDNTKVVNMLIDRYIKLSSSTADVSDQRRHHVKALFKLLDANNDGLNQFEPLFAKLIEKQRE